MAFNPRRGSLREEKKRAESGQAEIDDGDSPTITGDGPAAHQLPFEYLN